MDATAKDPPTDPALFQQSVATLFWYGQLPIVGATLVTLLVVMGVWHDHISPSPIWLILLGVIALALGGAGVAVTNAAIPNSKKEDYSLACLIASLCGG